MVQHINKGCTIQAVDPEVCPVDTPLITSAAREECEFANSGSYNLIQYLLSSGVYRMQEFIQGWAAFTAVKSCMAATPPLSIPTAYSP